MADKKINIAIIEPSDIIREGIISVLNKTEYNNYFYSFNEIDELLSQSNSNIDILVLNPVKIKNQNDLTLIKKKFPEVIITSFQHTIYPEENKQNFDIIFSIYSTISEIKERLLSNFNSPIKVNRQREEKLSDREIDVLKLVVAGLSNKEIAEKLFISIHTVISHRKKLTQKTGIKSQAGLTIYAISHKIVEVKDYN